MILSAALLQVCCAQNQRIMDSLLHVLKTTKEDTNKVNALNSLGIALIGSNPDTSIILGKQALSLSEKVVSKKHIANSYHVIARANYRKGNYISSLENNFKALSLREALADTPGISKSLGNIGIVYMEQADYPKALEYYYKALMIDEINANKTGIATKLGNIGIVYSNHGDYEKALEYYFKSLKIEEQLGNKNGIASTLNNIGIVYRNQMNYSKALDYYFKALSMAEQSGDKYLIAGTLGNIGLVYSTQGDFPKALDYYFKRLKMAEQVRNKYGIGLGLGTIGFVYFKTGMFAAAEAYTKKAIAVFDSIGAMNDLWQFEEQLSQLYDTTGRYNLALEHYKKAMVIKDTLYNQEKNKEITRKEMNYAFEKTQAKEKAEHEKQLAVADVEIKKQKVLKYSFIGSLVLTLLLFIFSYRFYRAQQVLRLQAIRNRIADDLHDDIGSTLNSISVYSEVAKQKSPAVVQELEHIGEASRKIIDAMSDIVWTINTNNDSFEQIILRLRSLTYNLLRAKNIEHTFRADESLKGIKLSMEHRRNFYLIFKEALNNLVKYSNASRVSIFLTHESNLITLLIHDNGVGFDAQQASAGNGLLSMKSRAKEMRADLRIESELGSGTTIELKLIA